VATGVRFETTTLGVTTSLRLSRSQRTYMSARYSGNVTAIGRAQLRRTLNERLDHLLAFKGEGGPKDDAIETMRFLALEVLKTDVPDTGRLSIHPDVDGFVDLTWRNGRRSVTASTDGSGPFEIFLIDLDRSTDVEETVPDRATAFQHLLAGVRAS
jgi:hypothetical protein